MQWFNIRPQRFDESETGIQRFRPCFTDRLSACFRFIAEAGDVRRPLDRQAGTQLTFFFRVRAQYSSSVMLLSRTAFLGRTCLRRAVEPRPACPL